MSSWFLFIAAVIFTWLAYDAWTLAGSDAHIPCQLVAKAWGEDVSGVPLREQNERKRWNSRYGLGDPAQSLWLWTILATACWIGAAWMFFFRG